MANRSTSRAKSANTRKAAPAGTPLGPLDRAIDAAVHHALELEHGNLEAAEELVRNRLAANIDARAPMNELAALVEAAKAVVDDDGSDSTTAALAEALVAFAAAQLRP